MNSDNSTFNTVLAMCQMMLRQKAGTGSAFLRPEDIFAVIDEVTAMPSFAAVNKEQLSMQLQERFTVVTAAHQTLGNNDDHKAWLPARRSEIRWRYWDRYLLFLQERVPSSAVESIDNVTNDILERIEDPLRQGIWDRRGLVMGHVQSGKTANYSGLICKAADAGYKVVIILAGIHNSLRSQTQVRLDEGFLGFMSQPPDIGNQAFKRVGVGLIDSSIVANTGTNRTQLGDFNEKVARQFGIHPGGLPLVFVVKKHVGVLDNLIRWIRSCADAEDATTGRKYVRNVPALIVDDEADLASVDTKQQEFDENGNPDEDHDPTKTNKNIRLLLRSFEKVAYVGYTATPFANIYIHDKGSTRELGDDLFPRSFIVSIPAPSNYMGPARVFGIREDEDAGLAEVKSLPIVRTVKDHAASDNDDETNGWMPPKLLARTDHLPRYDGKPEIPPSLRKALMSFILTVAARRQRDPGPKLNTMLVHVVRYTKIQKEVANQVLLALKDLRQRLENKDGDRSPTIFEEFQALYRDDYIPTTEQCSEILEDGRLKVVAWDLIHPVLKDIVTGTKIKIINGSAGDILDYEDHRETGMDVIAIGGDKLSRGLTLEGLSVSYFLRASRMYDTLMQMGRWFGYRDKYIDLCRLYTTPALLEWFAHIAAASVELQNEFDYMVSVGGTPKDYGLKVRSHPVLLVTSAVKMRNGTEMKLSFSGDISETTVFKRDVNWLNSNFRTAENWITSLGTPVRGQKIGGYVWKSDSKAVLDFLSKYKTHEEVRRADAQLLGRYIKAQNANQELIDWTILVASSGSAETSVPIGGHTIGLIKRAPHPELQRNDRYTIRRIVNPEDESTDLSDPEKENALHLTVENWKKRTDSRKSPNQPERAGGLECRRIRGKSAGLLILYPLDPKHAAMPSDSVPVFGMAVSFPTSETAQSITYTVNNVFTSRGGDDDSL